MHIDNQAKHIEQLRSSAPLVPDVAEPLGHVLSVGGSHVIMQFSTEPAREDHPDVTVGTFLGVQAGRTQRPHQGLV